QPIADARAIIGRLVPGDAVVFAIDDNRVFATIGDGKPREVAKLEGRVTSVAALGYRRFVAATARGHLARGPSDGGPIARAPVDVGAVPFVIGDPSGLPVIAAGDRLLRWEN